MKSKLVLIIMIFFFIETQGQTFNPGTFVGKKWYLCRKELRCSDEMQKNLKPCEKDNFIIFYANDTYEIREGELKCDDNSPNIIKRGTYSLEFSRIKIDDAYFEYQEQTAEKMSFFEYVDDYVICYTYGNTPEIFGYNESSSPDDVQVNTFIKVYCNSNCELGNKALNFLAKKNAKFKHINLDIPDNNQKFDELMQNEGYAKGNPLDMPVVVINNKTYWHIENFEKFYKRLIFASDIADEDNLAQNNTVSFNKDNTRNLSIDINKEPEKMKGMVERHNYWRTQIGVAPVVWSQKLTVFAKKWADHLAKTGCNLKYSMNPDYGENVFIADKSITPLQVVDSWTKEKDNYVYEPFIDHKKYNNYTQVIWETSTQIGCAKAQCPQGEIWVCEYNPAGNEIGIFPYKKKK